MKGFLKRVGKGAAHAIKTVRFSRNPSNVLKAFGHAYEREKVRQLKGRLAESKDFLADVKVELERVREARFGPHPFDLGLDPEMSPEKANELARQEALRIARLKQKKLPVLTGKDIKAMKKYRKILNKTAKELDAEIARLEFSKPLIKDSFQSMPSKEIQAERKRLKGELERMRERQGPARTRPAREAEKMLSRKIQLAERELQKRAGKGDKVGVESTRLGVRK